MMGGWTVTTQFVLIMLPTITAVIGWVAGCERGYKSGVQDGKNTELLRQQYTKWNEWE